MTASKLNRDAVNEFWHWFSANCQDFGHSFDNVSLLNELDTWVQKLGDFTWEIGPGKTMKNALTLSPGGNLELLPYTKEIISIAQGCEDWEYYYARQPKEWEMIFYLERKNGNTVEINAARWEYLSLRYDEGIYTILLKFVQSEQLSDDDKLLAAEIAIDGMLGEERRMLFIDEIEIVEEFEAPNKKNVSSFKDLAPHFNGLLPS